MRDALHVVLLTFLVALFAAQMPRRAFVRRPFPERRVTPSAAFVALDPDARRAALRDVQTSWQVQARMRLAGMPTGGMDAAARAEAVPEPVPLDCPGTMPPAPVLERTAPASSPLLPPSFAAAPAKNLAPPADAPDAAAERRRRLRASLLDLDNLPVLKERQ